MIKRRTAQDAAAASDAGGMALVPLDMQRRTAAGPYPGTERQRCRGHYQYYGIPAGNSSYPPGSWKRSIGMKLWGVAVLVEPAWGATHHPVGERLPTCGGAGASAYPVSCITSDTSCRATTVLHQSCADDSDVRGTGCVNCARPGLWGAWRVTAGSTRQVRSVSLKPEPSQRLWGIGSIDRTIFDNSISVQVQFLPLRCRGDSISPAVATDHQSAKRG